MGRTINWKTSVSAQLNEVTSVGTSKGKVSTTVISATTSIKNEARGVTKNGPKKAAIGKLTAKSTASLPGVAGLYLNCTWV